MMSVPLVGKKKHRLIHKEKGEAIDIAGNTHDLRDEKLVFVF